MPVLSVGIDPSGAIVGSKKAVGAFNNLVNSAKRAGFTLGQAGGSMDKAGKAGGRLKRVLGGLVAGFSAMIVARSVVRTIASFEEVMAQLEGVTSATEATMRQFNQTARDLGATTKFSATEAGDGLLFLARAGFTAEEAIAAIPATLNLAAAGMLGLGEAADIASNVLSQFGLAAEETERIADVLVNTANNANTNVQQLAEAMKLVGPVAGAMGRSVEETSAALGVLGDSGIQASLAGTNLRGVFSSLLGPTSKAINELERMKISLDEVNPEKNDLISIFEKFGAANITASEAVKIFGRRNAAAALIFAASTDKMKFLTKAYEENKGKSKEIADIMSKTLTGSFKSLVSAIQEAMLVMGKGGLGSVLKELIDLSTGVIRIFVGLGHTLGDNRAKYEAAANSVRLLLSAVSTLVAVKLFLWIKNVVIGLNAMNLALAANPFTLVAVALSALVSTILVFRTTTSNATADTIAWNETLEGTRSIVDKLTDAQRRLKRATDIGDLQAEVRARGDLIQSLEEASVRYRKLTESMKGEVGVTEEINNLMKRAGLEAKDLGGKFSTLGEAWTEVQHVFSLPTLESTTISFVNLETLIERIEKRIAILKKEAVKGGGAASEEMKKLQEQLDKLSRIDIVSPKDKGGLFKTMLDPGEQQQLADARMRVVLLAGAINDLTAAEKRRSELIGLTEEERTALEALNSVREEALDIAKLEGLSGELAQERADQIVGLYKEQTDELIRQTNVTKALIAADKERLTEQAKLKRFAESVGNSFSRMFEDAITGAKSLKDAIKDLAMELARLVLRQTVTQPLANAIGKAISGQITSGATMPASTTDPVGFQGGPPVGISEARISGPGAESNGGNTIINLKQTINTPDAGSFKKSEKQIMDGAVRKLRVLGD